MRAAASIPLGLLILLTGCSGSSPDTTALEPYANATLMPGGGLGGLTIGTTTLGTVVDTIGSGVVTAVASDESALELTYLDGQMSLLFIVAGGCESQTGGPGARLTAGPDMKAFLGSHPACKDLPLSSLSVGAGSSEGDTFFKGATDQGVRLWSPVVDSGRHGTPSNGPGRLMAGLQPNDRLERLDYPGLSVYFAVPGPTDAEIQSNRSLSPERLREIAQARRDARITRMTVVPVTE